MNLDYFHLINLTIGIVAIIWGIRIAFKCSGKLRIVVLFTNGVTLITIIQILGEVFDVFKIVGQYNNVFQTIQVILLLCGAISMELIIKEAKSTRR